MELFNIKNGYTPSKNNSQYWKDGTIPWFRMEDIRKNGNKLNDAIQKINICAVKGKKLFTANSFLVATSATIGEHALIEVEHLSNQRFTNISLKEEYRSTFNVDFLNIYLYKLDDWCKKNVTVSNFASVDMNGFRKFPFPLISINKQQRIVKILDEFDGATKSITEKLTTEIELRKKQYEYYRNQMLSFQAAS